MDFCLYSIYNGIIDHELYGRSSKVAMRNQMLYHFVLGKQKDMIRLIEQHGKFRRCV